MVHITNKHTVQANDACNQEVQLYLIIMISQDGLLFRNSSNIFLVFCCLLQTGLIVLSVLT